jgi:esterase/lipase superfamily enzyme
MSSHAAAVVRSLGLGVLLILGGCASESTLAPTPAIYTGPGARTQFSTATSAEVSQRKTLLYVTDRAPVVVPNGALSYGSDRSRQMSFGSVAIEIDRTQSSGGELRVGAVEKIGEVPRTPYPMQARPEGFRRAPAAVAAHEKAVGELQAEVANRLAGAARKEVVVFIHGYNNTFDDAVRSTANLCQFLGEEFVCVVLSWPAGGSRGVLFGYNVDRESGEFAVADMRKAIRAIAETKGVQKVHFLAHSRGADVMTSALQQLGIESYVSETSLSARLKVANIVMVAPDMDIDVAASRIFTAGSDPHLRFGRGPKPSATFQQGDLHLTVYDWGLEPLDAAARHHLLEILEERYGRRSAMITSQLPVDRWEMVDHAIEQARRKNSRNRPT